MFCCCWRKRKHSYTAVASTVEYMRQKHHFSELQLYEFYLNQPARDNYVITPSGGNRMCLFASYLTY